MFFDYTNLNILKREHLMRCILSSIGLSCESVYDYINDNIKKRECAIIITTAHPEKEKNKWAIKAAEQLKQLNFKRIIFLDLDKYNKTNLPKTDMLYVCGGNTFYLLNAIRQHVGITEFKKYVKQCKIYIGTSAGACILGNNIQVLEDIKMDSNEIHLAHTNGLNFLSRGVIPHADTFSIKPKILKDKKNYLCIANDVGYILNLRTGAINKITTVD